MSAAKNAAKSKSPQQPIEPAYVVIGDGWAAVAAVGFLVQNQTPVAWIAGTGAHAFAALPSLEGGAGVELWQRLARGFGIDLGDAVSGSFLREFRNKAFREPVWTKAPTPESRVETLQESLWGPERRLAPVWEARFALSINEIEGQVRELLVGESEAGEAWRRLIRRIEGIPVHGFRTEEDRVQAVILGSGEEISCRTVLYADRWDVLPKIHGLAKNLPFIRGREPASVLQAQFSHEQPVGAGLMEGFFGSLHKEAGEEIERHVWGHFSSDGMQSYWTLCLTSEEIEDNHQIAKKLRRMKNALDKMFTGNSWLPEGKAELMGTVKREAVRFHEAVAFGEGEAPTGPVSLSGAEGLLFVTDGYGPTHALVQVAAVLGLPQAAQAADLGAASGRPDSEAEGMHREGPAAS